VATDNSAQGTQQQDDLDIARQRLASVEAQLDPGTIRLLEALGVANGWHCLEIGAGSGSIAAWLSRRVGTSGRILTMDVDTQFFDDRNLSNLEVRQHNLATDELPESAFDLVHSRWVLAHLRDRPAALRQMLSAVKPGGWLMVEEPDFANARNASPLFRAIPNMDPFYGRLLYPDSRPLALRDVGLEGRMTVPQQPDQFILAGPITETNVADQINLLDYSTIIFPGPITFTVWGRRR